MFLIAAAVVAAVVAAPRAAGAPPAKGPTPQQSQQSQQTQQPPTPQVPVFRTGVNAVRVDVSVIGSNDLPVAGLQASDFTLTEDGIPQKIDTFQFLRLDGRPRPGASESLEIRNQDAGERAASRDDVRVFALFLDDYHVERLPSITIPLRDALVHFVDTLGPTDVVALMDPLTPLSALEFTRARAALQAQIRQFEGRQGEIFPVKSPAEEAQLRSGDIGRIRAQVSLSSLEALVTYLGSLKEGRKTVVYVSEGPRIGAISDLNSDVERVIRAANRGNVTINTLDPRGLGMTPFGGNDVAYRLAHETGGRAIVNTNNLKDGLDHVVADASAYYLLGYVPARDFNDGKFHRIEVKVDRRRLRVEARRGYWAPSAAEIAAAQAEAAKPVEPGLPGALTGLEEARAARLVNVWLGWSRGAGGTTHVTVAWEPARTGTDRTAASVQVEPVAGERGQALADARTLAAGEVGSLRPRAGHRGPARLGARQGRHHARRVDAAAHGPEPGGWPAGARHAALLRRRLSVRLPEDPGQRGPDAHGLAPLRAHGSGARGSRVLRGVRRPDGDRRAAEPPGRAPGRLAGAAARGRTDARGDSGVEPGDRRLRAARPGRGRRPDREPARGVPGGAVTTGCTGCTRCTKVHRVPVSRS